MAKASGKHGHGRYVSCTLAAGSKVRARALLGSKAVGDAEGPTLDEALRAMRTFLDDRDARQRAAREDGLPTAEEFVNAFPRLDTEITERHWLMLKALLTAPGRTLTATEIAAAAGYSSFSSANLNLGTLARIVAEDLGYRPDRRADGSPRWTTTFATGADPSLCEDDGLWRWTMRPQFAECLAQMNIGHAAA